MPIDDHGCCGHFFTFETQQVQQPLVVEEMPDLVHATILHIIEESRESGRGLYAGVDASYYEDED